eukprot:scaffold22647_cov145-Cylindrotheca_fusiformis.AAC.2
MTIKGGDAHNYTGGLNDLLGWNTSGSRGNQQQSFSNEQHYGNGNQNLQNQLDVDLDDLDAAPQYSESPQYVSTTATPAIVELEGTGTDLAQEAQEQASADDKRKIMIRNIVFIAILVLVWWFASGEV